MTGEAVVDGRLASATNPENYHVDAFRHASFYFP